MSLLSLNLPVIGQSSATEDQKIRDALAAIQTDYNGNLTDANISATAGIQEPKLASGANGLTRGSFSAYRNAAHAPLPGGLVQWDSEDWDVSGWFDVTTSRYTPLVAGQYAFSWAVMAGGTTMAADSHWRSGLRKNAAVARYGQVAYQRAAVASVNSVGAALLTANGTTDFFDVIIDHPIAGGQGISTGPILSFFQAHLVGRS